MSDVLGRIKGWVGHLAGRSPCVLVIDGGDQVRLLVRKALEEAGYRVLDAAAGRAGFEMLRNSPADVVILDIMANGSRLQMVLPEEEAIKYQLGDGLTCGFNLETTHVFARETGTAIR